jgi:hypothetical protein
MNPSTATSPGRTPRSPLAGRCVAGPGGKKSARTRLGSEAERARARAMPLDLPRRRWYCVPPWAGFGHVPRRNGPDSGPRPP